MKLTAKAKESGKERQMAIEQRLPCVVLVLIGDRERVRVCETERERERERERELRVS
jgi:hypothetical protein